MSPTVSEARFTRAAILWIMLLSMSLGLMALTLALSTFEPDPTRSLVMGAMLIASLFLFSLAEAHEHRGYCHAFWNQFRDIEWVLDDVDPDEVVHGPVEVPVR